MRLTRMWTTNHRSLDYLGGERIWLVATDGSERVFAGIEVDRKDGLFYVGTRWSDGKKFRSPEVIGIMRELFIATEGDVGVSV